MVSYFGFHWISKFATFTPNFQINYETYFHFRINYMIALPNTSTET